MLWPNVLACNCQRFDVAFGHVTWLILVELIVSLYININACMCQCPFGGVVYIYLLNVDCGLMTCCEMDEFGSLVC